MTTFINSWKPYSVLWKNEKSQRELLTITLADFETLLRKHGELDAQLQTEPDVHVIRSCLAISTERLKFGLATEIKSCTHRLNYDNKPSFFIRI